jgi:hypothetical protein
LNSHSLRRPGGHPAGIAPFGRGTVIASLFALGLYDFVDIVWWLATKPAPPFGDFFGLWTFGRFAAAEGLKIYDPIALQAFQQSLHPQLSAAGLPCPYPPSFLLLLIPLGKLPLATAYLCWIVATLLIYGILTLGHAVRSLYGAALLVAPTTLLTVISGQSGLLSAALLIGGLRQLRKSPILGGILLGLLTYKPQLGLLVPVALIAAREWRAIIAACTTVAVTVLGSATVLGWPVWQAWLDGMPLYLDLLRDNQASLDHLMPTLAASLHQFNAPDRVACAAQLILAIPIAAAIWRAFASRVTDRAIALTGIGALLVTPYAFVYDMPVVTAALAVERHRRKSAGVPVAVWEIVIVGVTFAAAMAMATQSLPFVVPALLFVIFSVIAVSDDEGTRTPRTGDLASHPVSLGAAAESGHSAAGK